MKTASQCLSSHPAYSLNHEPQAHPDAIPTQYHSQMALDPFNSPFPFASKATQIACEAGELLRRFYKSGVVTEYKGDVDLVTEADRRSEAYIKASLAKAFPTHGIFGEEGTRERLDAEYRWYIDPLDGTTNFAHGFPAFCVILGLEHRPAGTPADGDGIMVAGVIHDPLRHETFFAERGLGAWLIDGGFTPRPIHVSSRPKLQESLIATGFPSQKRHGSPNIHFYQEFTLRSHGVRRAGSAGLDLAYVACGRLEAFWEFNLNPWDTSAGYLLVEEAGGKATHFDGSKFTLNSVETLASNGLIHAEMTELFSAMFAGRDLSPIPTPAEFRAKREAGN
jgi:myo-inositol-1(or 4)-monophosphatase